MVVLRPAALALCLAAAAQGQFLADKLSFGYTGRINDKGQPSVPQFSIQGQPNEPEILSNKVILTQPSPGNARGAVWADNPNKYREWIADVDFRVNGPERGGGNLNIWLVRNGVHDVGTASVYKVGRFEGLNLIIDRSGGGMGMIRGFLNDGTTDYSTNHHVDTLAFGHCDYSYRNLGRPSQLKLRQTQETFKVEIDGRTCFESNKVQIPPGYHFGITAASAEDPDSFEIFKFVVMTGDLNAQHETPPSQAGIPQQQQHQQQPITHDNPGGHDHEKNMPVQEKWEEDIADVKPDTITSSKSQFADLHNRLQSVNHHLSTIFRSVANQGTVGEQRHHETHVAIHDLKQFLSRLDMLEKLDHIDRLNKLDKLDHIDKLDKIEALQNQIVSLEREIKSIRSDVASKVKESENAIKQMLGSSHGDMLLHVAEKATPKHGKLIFVIIGSQIILVGAYIFYERKKISPKKYL